MTLNAVLVTSSGEKSVLKQLCYFQLILSLFKGAAPWTEHGPHHDVNFPMSPCA